MTARILALLLGVLSVAGVTAAADADHAAKVYAFAKMQLNKQVGDGECATLATEALKAAGADTHAAHTDSPNPGDYVWGTLVYGLELTDTLRTESTPVGTTVKPGDIVQFRDVKLSGKTPTGATYTMTADHHTAVVSSMSKDGKRLTVLQQNSNGKKTVVESVLNLDDLRAGWIKVYRPGKK